MEYKRTYTKEEIEELVQWFRTNKYSNEVDLGQGIYVENVQKILDLMLPLALRKHENPVYGGQIHILFRLRDAIIQQQSANN